MVFSAAKAQDFKEYFGVHPDLVEGTTYFGNSEGA